MFSDDQITYLKTRRVLICTPFYMCQGFSQFFFCLSNTIRALDKIGVENDMLQINGGSYVDHNRNVAVNKFLYDYKEYTDLVFVDSDMEWDIIGFLRLLAAPYDVVGSAYPMKNNWESFSVRHYSNDDLTPKMADGGLIDAEFVPGGFLKISRNCLEKMVTEYSHKWYKNKDDLEHPFIGLFECVIDSGERYGEDTEFCRKWAKIGGKIYCEPRVTFSHWGVKPWTGNYHEFLIKQPHPGIKE